MSEQEKKTPLVSFVMNCYNGEKYLHRSLETILKQTYQNWELVFWDNASTDHSKEVLESYHEPRFKYFRSKENVTLGQARAWAVEVCQGEYIAFLDVDDEWLPEKTEKQVCDMLSDDYVLSYSGVVEVDEANTEHRRNNIPQYESGYIFKDLLNHFDINLPAAMIKRQSLIDKGLNFDPFVKASEEYCLFMQLIYGEKVSVVKEPLANYYIRRDSLTFKCIDRWYIERFYTLDRIKKTHSEAEEKFSKEFKSAYARGTYYKARYLMYQGKRKEAREELKTIRQVDKRYKYLLYLSYLPTFCWNYAHQLKNMR
jgi:glycosyltransferase involved in cell wall biosynthesis